MQHRIVDPTTTIREAPMKATIYTNRMDVKGQDHCDKLNTENYVAVPANSNPESDLEEEPEACVDTGIVGGIR